MQELQERRIWLLIEGDGGVHEANNSVLQKKDIWHTAEKWSKDVGG